MSRIVLFRFHRALAVCRNRLQLLRLFNPGVGIHGLYGGPEGEFPAVRRRLAGLADDLYCISGKSGDWKWKHADLAVRQWYRDRGRGVAFDAAHLIEWDMLCLDSVEHICRHVPDGAVALSGLTPLHTVGHTWIWTSREPNRTEWEKLLQHVRREHGYRGEPYAGIAGGAVLSREFLERYSRTDVPELCNDEVRIPLYAQVFGIALADTRLYSFADPALQRHFNLRRAIETAAILRESRLADGARVFHPYYKCHARLADGCAWHDVRHDLVEGAKRVVRRLMRRGAGAS